MVFRRLRLTRWGPLFRITRPRLLRHDGGPMWSWLFPQQSRGQSCDDRVSWNKLAESRTSLDVHSGHLTSVFAMKIRLGLAWVRTGKQAIPIERTTTGYGEKASSQNTVHSTVCGSHTSIHKQIHTRLCVRVIRLCVALVGLPHYIIRGIVTYDK